MAEVRAGFERKSVCILGIEPGLRITGFGVIGREGAFAARRIVNQQALARLERRFDALPVRSFPESATASPTARDLNLFGAGSVAQWLGAVATPSGRETLAAWLTERRDSARDVVERQGAVDELAPQLDFRQELEVAAMPLAATSAATARFAERWCSPTARW